jgi:predicted transcriptional regulator
VQQTFLQRGWLARNIRSMNQKGESEKRIADLLYISVEEVRAYLIN